MMNYHELTMNEPRDSPQRRKQFLVISAIMAGMTVHAGLNAGLLASIDIADGTFPGGEFVYKFMTKDYAASTGTLRTIAEDLDIVEEGGGGSLVMSEKEGLELDTADLLYSILLDDPAFVPGGHTRFAGGVLLPSAKGDKKKGSKAGGAAEMKRRLMEDANGLVVEGNKRGSDTIHSKDVKYEAGNLPKVNAAVAQHPFTAGAWSAILQSYKIIPKFKKYAESNGEEGKSPVVIATCSASQKMCTYYMPLAKRDKFYLGRPTTERYATEFEGASALQRMGIEFGETGLSVGGFHVGNVFRGIKRALGMGGGGGGGSKKKEEEGDEL